MTLPSGPKSAMTAATSVALVTALASPAVGAPPTHQTRTQTVTLQENLEDLARFGPFIECAGFVVVPEFTVTRRNTTFETRQIRHYSYTGRLYRVDPKTLEVGGSVAYEGRATRIATFPLGGSADEFTSVQITGRHMTVVTEDGRRRNSRAGLLSVDHSTDPSSFRSVGFDDQEVVCAALA